jgi:hypothetical protein
MTYIEFITAARKLINEAVRDVNLLDTKLQEEEEKAKTPDDKEFQKAATI